MNIGILIDRFGIHDRDWQTPTYQNFVRLLGEQHHVRVFPFYLPKTDAPYESANSHIFPNGGTRKLSPNQHLSFLEQIKQTILRHHQAIPFDVLHAIGGDEIGGVATDLGRDYRIPSVVSLIGDELVRMHNINFGLQLDPYASKFVLRSVKKATSLIVPSKYAATLLHQFAQDRQLQVAERTFIVPYGIDINRFKLPDQENRDLEFLHVGKLKPVKRQDILLTLMAKLPGTQLDIVGDGKWREKLVKLAIELGIEDRVMFHGAVPHHDLSAFYQRARFFVMTSQHEMFGVEALEALACGMEVYGSNVGILPEIGKAVRFGDLEGLVTHLLGRSRTRSDVRRIQRFVQVQQGYTVQHMVDGVLDVYQHAIDRFNRR